jgi:diacylglycerol diphosphate phosphatase/phosphatidate phosphatase
VKREHEDVLPMHHRPSISQQSVRPGPNGRPTGLPRRYTDQPRDSEEDLELEGTVRRPDPGPLHEVWTAEEESEESPDNTPRPAQSGKDHTVSDDS